METKFKKTTEEVYPKKVFANQLITVDDLNDKNHTRYALSLSTKYKDKIHLYEHYKDLNDWAMNNGKGRKKSFRPKL